MYGGIVVALLGLIPSMPAPGKTVGCSRVGPPSAVAQGLFQTKSHRGSGMLGCRRSDPVHLDDMIRQPMSVTAGDGEFVSWLCGLFRRSNTRRRIRCPRSCGSRLLSRPAMAAPPTPAGIELGPVYSQPEEPRLCAAAAHGPPNTKFFGGQTEMHQLALARDAGNHVISAAGANCSRICCQCNHGLL